jgi:hypothetical protein
MDQPTSFQIIKGGCYQPSPELAPRRFRMPTHVRRSSRRGVALFIFILMVILGFFIWRRFSRNFR